MVTFCCDCCNASLKKGKVKQHLQSCCRGSSVSCIDCGKVFQGFDFEQHNSCISEAEKYQKGLYRPKQKRGPPPPKTKAPEPTATATDPAPTTPATPAATPAPASPAPEPSPAPSPAPAVALPDCVDFKWKHAMKKVMKQAPAGTMTLAEFEEALLTQYRDCFVERIRDSFKEMCREKAKSMKHLAVDGDHVHMKSDD
ncbi:putative cell growth-regulating nucleolar protein [Paratrimastix pyriformis]|uniref:Cell growth-regulating nucleolar protein n=1 Tax=Paratrimastix pyriformis TaxID=342808 RepID=A0ABQ8UN06_9EUKA|nr:putative cell growth-regulating nucleolar protein [Paratrimastix pyriformis]